jgi:lysozyme
MGERVGGNVDRDALKKQLVVDEGLRLHAYQDSLGYWTIGVGRNIDRRGPGLTNEEAIYLLDNDISRVCTELDTALPWWKSITPARQTVLANMCFNMGLNTLLQFKNTLGAMERGEWEAAAYGMESSKWYKQVGARAARLVDIMRKGS